MSADKGPAPSTSSTHLPPHAGPADEPPPRGRATASGDRGAQLARLGDRIAELSARIQAATHELLVLIRELDEQEGWDGCLTCAHWLSWRAGLSPGAAREHVRVARALGELPKLSDAMRPGRVSYSKVRAVTRVATPENEQALLDVALAGTGRTWSGSPARGGASTGTWSRRRSGGGTRAAGCGRGWTRTGWWLSAGG